MKILKVRLADRSYPILIGRRLLARLGKLLRHAGLPRKVLITTSRAVGKLYLSSIVNHLEQSGFDTFVHYLPDGEAAKSGKALFEIFDSLLKSHFDRNSFVLALGGGAVGDVSGFAASVYFRGIPWVVVPTTLLSQVDSSIGGKTAINLPEGKNLIGTFYQPRLVVSDVEVLRSLPKEELVDSLAEVIKYGMMVGGRFFEFLEKEIQRVPRGDPGILEKIVFQCARIKKEIVEMDETEQKGLRFLLNYGHTFAHAFEGAASFHRVRHGSAVAVGMMAAADLALRLGLFSVSARERQKRLIEKAELPTDLRSLRISVGKILAFMERDKKARGGRLRFILPQRIGKLAVCEKIPKRWVEKTLQALC